MIKKITNIILMAIVSLATANTVLAADAPVVERPSIIPGESETLLIPNKTIDGVPQEQYFGGVLLPALTTTVISLSAGLALLFIIIGGIQILTAYGEDEKVVNGRKTMMFAIIGLAISILSYAIVSIISAIKLG